MAENICPQCKAVNRATARFCAECGAPLLSGPATGQPSGLVDEGLQPGTILQKRYRIEKELGRGGFGAVYKAWDSNLNHMCALKENLDTSPEAQRQFAREATVLANLSHPNLPRVTDHFSIPDQGQYLVMDFVEGEDLATLTNQPGGISVEQALKWIGQVADALVYLHGRQPPVLHRDIKPANIRITPEGQAMLVDFGLVKLYDPHLKTTVGARAVTPGFAPPEQYGRGRTDARSDVYALGATLYCVATRRDPLESVQRLSGEVMLPAHQTNPLVPVEVSQAIEKAMALDPQNRFQSASEFRTALSRASAPFQKAVEEPPLKTVAASEDRPFVQPVRPLAGRPDQPRALADDYVGSYQAGSVSPISAPAYGAQDRAMGSGSVPSQPGDMSPGSTMLVSPASEAPVRQASGAALGEAAWGNQAREARQDRGGTKKFPIGLLVGIVAVAVLVCIIAVVAGYSIVTSNLHEQQTQTAVVMNTSTAQQLATVTRQTATAVAQASLTAAASATQLAQLAATESANQTATARAQATEAARAQRTATAAARITATAQYLQPFLGVGQVWPVVLSDDFSDNKNGWSTGPKSDDYQVSTLSVADGVYRVESKALQGFSWRLWPDNMPTMTDFYVALDMRQVSGPDDGVCGLTFRKDEGSDYYALAISDNSQYRWDLHTSSGWEELKAWADLPGWNSGVMNHVVLVGKGSSFTLYVNDQMIGQLSDNRLASGIVTLFVELFNAKEQGVWEFDNIEVRAP